MEEKRSQEEKRLISLLGNIRDGESVNLQVSGVSSSAAESLVLMECVLDPFSSPVEYVSEEIASLVGDYALSLSSYIFKAAEKEVLECSEFLLLVRKWCLDKGWIAVEDEMGATPRLPFISHVMEKMSGYLPMVALALLWVVRRAGFSHVSLTSLNSKWYLRVPSYPSSFSIKELSSGDSFSSLEVSPPDNEMCLDVENEFDVIYLADCWDGKPLPSESDVLRVLLLDVLHRLKKRYMALSDPWRLSLALGWIVTLDPEDTLSREMLSDVYLFMV